MVIYYNFVHLLKKKLSQILVLFTLVRMNLIMTIHTLNDSLTLPGNSG